jgi:hypothetical protein
LAAGLTSPLHPLSLDENLEAARRRRCRWLGVVLLAGAFLPILYDASAKYWFQSIWDWAKLGAADLQSAPSVTVLFFPVDAMRENVPLLTTLNFYLLMAGLAALSMAGARWKARALTILVLGLPALILISGLPLLLILDVSPAFLLWPLLMLGLAGISVGSLARTSQPENRAAHEIAQAGAVLTTLSLLPAIVLCIMLLAEGTPSYICMDVTILLAIVLMAAAAILCFANRRSLAPQRSIRLGRIAFRLVAAGALSVALLVAPAALFALATETPENIPLALVSVYSIIVKACFLVFGPMLLLLFGAADLIVGEPEA